MWNATLYSCESWTLNKCITKLINAAEMWFYRLLKLKLLLKLPNETVLNRLKAKIQLFNKIKRLQLQFIGHIIRGKGLEWDCLSGKI